MPELVACPVCGLKVQMADATLGKQVRCAGCHGVFTARSEAELPPTVPDRPGRLRPITGEEGRKPFCPACGRPVAWEAVACPFCGEEFEPELAPTLLQQTSPRRDVDAHRGPLLATLGNVCLITGGLSVCTCGLGALVSLPLGIVTWVMANFDLSRMRAGQVDPAGKEATESGRTGAVLGIVLGVIFAACHAVWWRLGRW